MDFYYNNNDYHDNKTTFACTHKQRQLLLLKFFCTPPLDGAAPCNVAQLSNVDRNELTAPVMDKPVDKSSPCITASSCVGRTETVLGADRAFQTTRN